MKLRAELPHFRAMCRDGSAWFLDLAGLDSFKASWMHGTLPFWSGVDAYGAAVVVKLGDITGLAVWDTARLSVDDDEAAELKARGLTTSD